MSYKGTSDHQKPLLPQEDELNVPVSHIYKIKTESLQDIFKQSDQQVFNEELLEIHGKAKGILKKLASEQNTGIVGDEKDLKRRKKVFGENLRPEPPAASIKESIVQTLQNILWVIIGVTAALSSIISIFFIGDEEMDAWKEFCEGISIIIVSIFLVAIITLTDFVKDRKYIELSKNIKEEKIPVIRGKLGATQSISVWDVVVGDVVILETGTMVPADCLIIEAQDLQVDEPSKTDENGQLYEQNRDINKNVQDPCLLAGSIIKRGSARAVVCCVGANSTRGIIEPKLDTDKDTALQTKLKNLERQFVKFAFFSCIVVLVLIVIMLIVKLSVDESWYVVLGYRSIKFMNFIVVLFVVIVPEGLPLTIGVSLAYTTGRMYLEDRILVKELDAPEKMGEVNEILVGKTSTITTGDMKIAQFLCEDKQIKNTRKNTLLHCELSNITLELIKESILFNCSARIEMETTTFVPVGNATEVGLLKFLQDADIPVHLLIQQKLGRVKTVSPFNSIKKRSATVIENPNRPGTITVYIKGAPEVILEMCTSIQNSTGIVQLSPDLAEEIRREVDAMASKPLRVISFAYFEMDMDQWNAQFESTGKEFEQALDDRNIQFTFLGAFGLKDPLRKNVKSMVNAVQQKGHVKVRMISGDHIETAKRVAYKAGILTDDDLRKDNCVMDAEEFRLQVGQIEQTHVEGENGQGETKLSLEHQENFISIADNCKVLARANSDDKLLFVIGLKNYEHKVVSVTGDGINDIEALEAANVGLAMGSGCSAAKQASSMILVNDDFESAIRAIMWGRNIYHNVGRFLQFQVTVNLSVLLVVVVGILCFNESPLSAVQLLWINLIMDTFAAIALSTEPPMEKILRYPPTSKVQIMTAAIWRQILGITLWNFLLILILFIFGTYIGGLESFGWYSDKVTAKYKTGCPDGFDTDEIAAFKAAKGAEANWGYCKKYWGGMMKKKLFTYVYCTFVFMQLFNYFNCRKIGQSEMNVFERMFSKVNKYFWIVLVFVSGVQVLQVQWFSSLFRVSDLSRSEWGACIVAGSTVLLISALLKLTGRRVLDKIPFTKFVDENNAAQDGFVNKITAASNIKVNIPANAFQRGAGTPKNKGDYDELNEDDNNYQNFNDPK